MCAYIVCACMDYEESDDWHLNITCRSRYSLGHVRIIHRNVCAFIGVFYK